ncbi:protein CYSTEINE-RICH TRANSMEMBRANE MODULE 6-like [Carex rostrata]
MSNYNQHQTPPVFAPPTRSTNSPLAQSYPVQAMHTSAYAAPPPVGYPTKDTVYAQQVPTKTTSRGGGCWDCFWSAIECCCHSESNGLSTG